MLEKKTTLGLGEAPLHLPIATGELGGGDSPSGPSLLLAPEHPHGTSKKDEARHPKKHRSRCLFLVPPQSCGATCGH